MAKKVSITPREKKFSIEKERLLSLGVAVIFIIIGFLLYSSTFHASFQFDDRPTIVNNPIIKNLQNIKWLWDLDPSRFLTHLTFALNYHFARLNPLTYHLTNLFIHLLTAFFVYLFVRLTLAQSDLKEKMTGSQCLVFSFLSGMIFLVHPLQTAAVSYIVQRATLLSTFFYLLTLVFYILSRTRRRNIYYALAILSAFAGLFTKPIIMTLPLAILLYEICFLQKSARISRKMIFPVIPFVLLAMAVPVLLVLWKYQSFHSNQLLDLTRETEEISRKEYLLTQLNVITTYIRLLFLPISQNLDYDYPISRTIFQYPTWRSFCILAASVFTGIKICKKNRIIAFSIFLFFITLGVESSFFPISDVIFEHRLYLPMISFSLLLPTLFFLFLKDTKRVTVGLLIVLIGFSMATYRRNNVWLNPFTLWSDVVKKSPHKARPHLNLGIAFMEIGEYGEALRYFEKAISLNPDYADVYQNRGYTYSAIGEHDKALADYNEALKIKPDFIEVYNNRGFLYARLGKNEEALEDYNTALGMNPHMDVIYNNRGNIYLARKEYDLALADYAMALKLNPDYAKAYHNRGTIYRIQGQYDLAVAAYTRALMIAPNFAITYYHRSLTYAGQGAYQKALMDALKAKSLGFDFNQSYIEELKTYQKKMLD